jgi:hypothetical protein
MGAVSSAQGIRMSIQQIWSGLEPFQSNPYYAHIENNGPNTTGLLSTNESGEKLSIDYPVELPSGTKKRVLFSSGSSNDGKVVLHTALGSKEASIKGSYSTEQTRFGLISDNPSDLIFLKSQASSSDLSSSSSAVGVGGCTPDDAPDRSFGYNCLDAVVLGDGTEKLRDEQIRAIKLFVQSGGSLVFVGGAAQSASNDARWKDLLPISNPHVITREGLTELVGSPRFGSISTSIARGSCFGRSYGGGIVSIVSINPFESPMRESEDRKSIMMKAVRWNHKQAFRQLIKEQIGQESDESSMAMSATASGGPSGYMPGTVRTKGGIYAPISAGSDPFQIKPPSLENIMWILIGYAIVVVPLNFLILKKLKKMELAWISTPVISVLFSLILLNSTIGLYKANATTRTASVAILGDENDESLVFGKSEMFFPRAKAYDLELQDVESILTGNIYDRSDSGGMNLKDDGRHVIAPDVQTANLAFKELGYVQTSRELHGLTMKLIQRDGQACVLITNHSRIGISNLMFCGTGLQETVTKEIPSGGSLVQPVGKFIRSKLDSKHPDSVTGWQKIASSSPNKIVVLASADSMQVGPKYGAGHPGSRYMVVSMPQWDSSGGGLTHE